MRRSIDKILVSHAGNLPRPDDLNELLKDPLTNAEAIRDRLDTAVEAVIVRQMDCGVDIVNDGEYVKAGSYSGYMHARVTGWETQPIDEARPRKRAFRGGARDLKEFPGFFATGLPSQGSGGPVRPGFFRPPAEVPSSERVCVAAITYIGQAAIERDIRALEVGLRGKDAEGFVASLGPLSLGASPTNLFYATEEEYMMAVADAVRQEYKAVTDAGFIVQVDEPEFATSWQYHPDWTLKECREYLEFCVEVINRALAGVPRDLVRFHVCWGSGHRPHTNDIPLKDIVDLLLRIDAEVFSIEAANVRHAHEWKIWQEVKLPEGVTLMPGVISHATDLVEHPDLVAERLINYASVVGRENVQAGTDCGIGSRVGHEEVAWAKLRAMGEGAAIASNYLWHRD